MIAVTLFCTITYLVIAVTLFCTITYLVIAVTLFCTITYLTRAGRSAGMDASSHLPVFSEQARRPQASGEPAARLESAGDL